VLDESARKAVFLLEVYFAKGVSITGKYLMGKAARSSGRVDLDERSWSILAVP
jgi:hypothetical protein